MSRRFRTVGGYMTVSNFVSIMRDIDRETVLTAVPVAPGGTEFAWGMGPFPARIRVRLDPVPDADLAAQVLLDVVVAEVADIARVHGAWAAGPEIAAAEDLFPGALPIPSLHVPLRDPRYVQITFAVDLADFSRREALVMYRAGSVYAWIMARLLGPDLTPAWAHVCERYGLLSAPTNVREIAHMNAYSRASAWDRWAAA
jgi:hypothetical protein